MKILTCDIDKPVSSLALHPISLLFFIKSNGYFSKSNLKLLTYELGVVENGSMRNFTFILSIFSLLSCNSERLLNSYEINIFQYHVGELDSLDSYRYKARIDIMDSAFVLNVNHPDSEDDKDKLTPYVFLLTNCESAPKNEQGFYCIEDTLTYQINNKEEMIFRFILLNAPSDGWESVYFHPQIGEVINFGWGWFTVSITERIDDPKKDELLSQLRKKLLGDTANFPGKHPQTLYNNR